MKPSVTALALATAFAAATPLPAAALDLLQAWQEAAVIDPLVAASQSQATATSERIPQVQATLGPTLNAAGSANAQVLDTTATRAVDYTSGNIALVGTMPLYRPANVEALRQSELAAQITEVQVQQARQDLILRVAQAYFDVLIAEDSLAAIRVSKQLISEQFASAKRNFEVGTATITDQQEAQSRLDLTRAQEVAAENDLDVRRALLAQLIGRPLDPLNTLRRGIEVRPPEASREGEWANIARQQNNLVRQAELTTEIAKREIDRARYGGFPTLDLVGQIAGGRNTTSSVGIRSASGLAGLQFNWPVYTGGAVPARVREAIALQDKSQFETEQARRNAEQAARQTFLGVKSGIEQVRALEAAERSTQLSLESNQLGYQVGVRISIDVLNAVQLLSVTQRDLSRARYDVLLNGLRLKSTAGDLTETDVRTINSLLEPPRPPEPVPSLTTPGATGRTGTGTTTAPSAAPGGSTPGAAPGAGGAGAAGTSGQRPGAAPTVRGGRSQVPVVPAPR
jgi:outer membrane protein